MSKIVNIDTVIKSFCEQCCECGHCSEECNDVAKLKKISAEEQIATSVDVENIENQIHVLNAMIHDMQTTISDLQASNNYIWNTVEELKSRIDSGTIPSLQILHNDMLHVQYELHEHYAEFKRFKEQVENS